MDCDASSHEPEEEPKSLLEMNGEEVFRLFAEAPVEWFLQAIGLLRSAYVLWVAHSHCFNRRWARSKQGQPFDAKDYADYKTDKPGQGYVLLAGCAFENLIKGLIVAGAGFECPDGKLPEFAGGHGGHNLLELAKQHTGLTFSASEKRLLKNLTDAIIWKGRYHTPKKQGHLPKNDPATGYFQHYPSPQQTTDLFSRIMRAYPEGALSKHGNIGGLPAFSLVETWVALLAEECGKLPGLGPCGREPETGEGAGGAG